MHASLGRDERRIIRELKLFYKCTIRPINLSFLLILTFENFRLTEYVLREASKPV